MRFNIIDWTSSILQLSKRKEKWEMNVQKGIQWWDLWWTLERVNSHLMWLEWIMMSIWKKSIWKDILLYAFRFPRRFYWTWFLYEVKREVKWFIFHSIWGSNELNSNNTLKWNNNKLKGNNYQVHLQQT